MNKLAKEMMIFLLIISIIILSTVLITDYKVNDCKTDSLGINIKKNQICNYAKGNASFIYYTNPWLFESKECEVRFTC
jgi:competence protein ComGC